MNAKVMACLAASRKSVLVNGPSIIVQTPEPLDSFCQNAEANSPLKPLR
jgi:hypothetical protein